MAMGATLCGCCLALGLRIVPDSAPSLNSFSLALQSQGSAWLAVGLPQHYLEKKFPLGHLVLCRAEEHFWTCCGERQAEAGVPGNRLSWVDADVMDKGPR